MEVGYGKTDSKIEKKLLRVIVFVLVVNQIRFFYCGWGWASNASKLRKMYMSFVRPSFLSLWLLLLCAPGTLVTLCNKAILVLLVAVCCFDIPVPDVPKPDISLRTSRKPSLAVLFPDVLVFKACPGGFRVEFVSRYRVLS